MSFYKSQYLDDSELEENEITKKNANRMEIDQKKL